MDESHVSAQTEFDAIYISSSEICKDLGISRATLMQGRARGLLPDPVTINSGHILIWKRASVDSNIAAWKLMLKARRGELSA